MSWGDGPAFRKWLGVPKGFGSQIRTTSQAEARFRRLTPVLLVACFCLSLVTTVAHHQPNLIFWSLSALFTAAATLGVSLALNLPLRMLGGKLAKLGVALAGWPGLLAGKGCKAALLLDQDIYPPGTVALAGSRVFGSLSMERTVAFTASVIRASGSGLTYLFDKLVRAEGSGYLPIEKIVMQEHACWASAGAADPGGQQRLYEPAGHRPPPGHPGPRTRCSARWTGSWWGCSC